MFDYSDLEAIKDIIVNTIGDILGITVEGIMQANDYWLCREFADELRIRAIEQCMRASRLGKKKLCKLERVANCKFAAAFAIDYYLSGIHDGKVLAFMRDGNILFIERQARKVER